MSGALAPRTLGSRAAMAAATLVVVLYAGAIAFRPLNANDLFWHLAAGREILRTGAVPHSDPFSFASDPVPWIDHEWLWQVGAEHLFDSVNGAITWAEPHDGRPLPAGLEALIFLGVGVAAAAFGVAAFGLVKDRVPAAGVVVLGLLAAEAARQRLMVRPETMSLLFLAVFLVALGTKPIEGAPGEGPSTAPRRGRPLGRVWARALALTAIAALWANVHPAVLLAPVIVVLHAVGTRWGPPSSLQSGPGFEGSPGYRGRAPLPTEGMRPPIGTWLTTTIVLAGLTAAGTLANPYGWRLWTVPSKLAALVKTKAFFNPEWLRPPVALFPVFYMALALVVAAGLLSLVGYRRLPEGRILVALAVGALTCQQMRHMGLFAIAFLLAGGALFRALDPGGALRAALSRPLATGVALAGGLVALVPAHAPGVHAIHRDGALEAGRFPVEACERIADEGPALRLFNDVQFGGYLIWRFFPPRQVFIDGRNELYESLLTRLGRIQTGEAPYEDWKRLLAEKGIDGALVKDKGEGGMVTFRLPPSSAGEEPRLVRRAFSAIYFPVGEWALVWFDDTAMVFVRRGGAGEAWRAKGEYRALNPEDAAFVLDKAARDPAFAALAMEEAERRVEETPRSQKAERLLTALRGIPAAVPQALAAH